MSDVPLPAEAVSAAMGVLCLVRDPDGHTFTVPRADIIEALAEASPHIAKAERERLLATPLGIGGSPPGEYPEPSEAPDEWSRGYRSAMADFADLLRKGPS